MAGPLALAAAAGPLALAAAAAMVEAVGP